MSEKAFNIPTIEEMLEAGIHFGHQTRRWNPKMSKYIFEKDNGSHVVDLYQTQEALKKATEFLFEVAKSGRQIVMVGTKRQARQLVLETAKDCNVLFVTERWLGGTFTNYKSIERNIKELDKLISDKKEGKFDKYTKKEKLLIDRKIAKLERFYGGIRDLPTNPGALIVVDVKKEHTAIREANAIKVPVVGIVDTNSDPKNIDIVIPANDDAIKSIGLILKTISQGIKTGAKLAKPKSEVEVEKPKAEVVVEKKFERRPRPFDRKFNDRKPKVEPRVADSKPAAKTK